jgi:two-component system sensor histidine kinase UhpB
MGGTSAQDEWRVAKAMSHVRARRPIQTLFRRLFLINGLVFAVGTLLLAFSPATGSSAPLLAELPILIIGLALILAANALLVRASLSPLAALTSVMQRVDLLRTRDRIPHSEKGDLGQLIRAFNEMLDRLEAERTASSAHALAAQEGERQRIAQELHDEIGQSLTVALLGLKHVVEQTPDHLREEALMAQTAVRSSLNEVRQVAHRLRPGVLADLGLHSALSSLSSEFSLSSGLDVTAAIDTTLPALSDEVELVLYRVAQESLTNVARHSGATEAELALSATDAGVTLRITDNGRGGPIQEGAGIRGMRERALLIDAELEITTTASGGIEVCLSAPGTTRGD